MDRFSLHVSALKVSLALPFVSGGLFITSLFLPAYQPIIQYAKADVYQGWAALLLGPIGLFAGHFSWLANLMWYFAVSAFERRKYEVSAAVSIIGLLTAATFLLNETVPVGSSGSFPYKVRFGYYVWLASIAVMALAAMFAARAASLDSHKNAP